MSTQDMTNQIEFHYRSVDSATGVTRDTTKRLAEHLGVNEIEVIHLALRELAMAMGVLPQYEADDGPLTTAQFCQISRARRSQSAKRSVRSSLMDVQAV